MKKFTIIVALIIAVAFVGSAMAVPRGKQRSLKAAQWAKSLLTARYMLTKGLKCNDCHKDGTPFTMKKGTAKIKMADHNAGKLCFSCHNGTKAFASKENCAKCHKKQQQVTKQNIL